MVDTTIRLSDDAKDRLDLHKRAGESYEDVIVRLADRDGWLGFGALSDAAAGTREGLRAMRDRRRGVPDDAGGTRAGTKPDDAGGGR